MSIGNGFPWRRITMYMRENGRIRDMLSPTNNNSQPEMIYLSIEEHSALIAEKEKEIERLKKIANEIDHVMNWNADHICRCFTDKHPKRNPNCQYHRVEELTRQALSGDAGRNE